MACASPILYWDYCKIGHFTVVCLVTWPLSGTEAGGDLFLIEALPLFTCKSCCSHANQFAFPRIKTRSTLASLPLKGQVTRHATVKRTIDQTPLSHIPGPSCLKGG